MTNDDMTKPEPWWKFGHVWLVIAGPCAVVIAGFVTAFIAMSSPDPVLTEDSLRRGVETNEALAKDKDKAMMPALQGRNHAATPAAAPAR